MSSSSPVDMEVEEPIECGPSSDRPPSVTILKVLWPLALGLGVMVVIAYMTWDPAAFRNAISGMNVNILAGAVLMLALRILLGGWRLNFVSRHRLSFMAALRGQLAWDFASNVTPSVVGGAPLAAYYIARESRIGSQAPIRIGEATAMMTYIMLLDQVWFALSVPVVIVSAAFMEVIPSNVGSLGTWTIMLYFVLLMAYSGVFAYATLFHPELLVRLADWIFRLPFLRRFRDRVSAEMQEFSERAAVLRRQKADFFLRGMLLSAGTWLARYSLIIFILWAFVPDIDKLLLFLRSIAMTISSLIMPTPGGAGGVEGLFALFFGTLLVDKAVLAPALLLWRTMAYYIFLVFGAGLSTRHIQETVRARKVHTFPPPAPDPPVASSPEIVKEEVQEAGR